MRVLNHFIDGKFQPSLDSRTFEDLGPATGELVARVARGSSEDVDRAVAAARRALQGDWGRCSVAERADWIDALASGLEARFEELAALESLDTGKPVSLARMIDIPRAVKNLRFFAGAARHQETGCPPMDGALNYTLRRPLGVVGLITPWNLPLYLLTWKLGPALAMGNTVVAKPSELTPLTAGLLGEIAEEVGLPAGVLNIVQGFGPEVGQALVEHSDVSAISFTGGTSTGAQVGATASSRFKKVSLELGGKNASIVFDDCDFDETVAGVTRAGFANQGQVCLCGSRILVQSTIHDRFVEALTASVQALRPGDPSLPETNFGSLISTGHREKVAGYVALAKEEGGTVVVGGGIPELPGALARGAFFQPTVVAGLAHDSRTATEEIFGPVVTVHPFEDEAEAVRIANEVRYGLAASVWTSDLRKAHRVSANLEPGTW